MCDKDPVGSQIRVLSLDPPPPSMQVHIKFGWFMPALVEKTRLLLAVSDWEQVWGSVKPRHHHITTLSVNSSAARPASLFGSIRPLPLLFPMRR